MRETVSIYEGVEIDRTDACDPDEPVVYVTLPNGAIIRFWVTNLTNSEYKFRAERVHALDENCKGSTR